MPGPREPPDSDGYLPKTSRIARIGTQHFLRSFDGSQNAVGAVLLQWHDNEDNPRPVAFMSRKLSGAQYTHDTRNVEALAAQMALTTWRTLLLGVKFEIFLDHDSLQFLFTQKSPSQRILRLCEFLADYDFEEVKYVSGLQNVVLDF